MRAVAPMTALGCTADEMCSPRAFLLLTRCGSRRVTRIRGTAIWNIALSAPVPLGIARDLFQHWLPRLLLRLDKRKELGRRHRIGVVASRFKLGPGCRIKDCLAQVVAQLAHNRVGRADRSDQSEPAAGTEAWKCLRDGGQVRKVE